MAARRTGTRYDKAEGLGFTLTELLVLVGVGALLSSVLAADLGQSRSQLLRDACAANLKQWGLAIRMYMDDYSGTFYYDVGGLGWADVASPYARYLGGDGGVTTAHTMVHTMRLCPSRIGQVSTTAYICSYAMPVGLYRHGPTYANADQPGSPFFYGTPTPYYWPNLKSVPQPAQYLMLIESNGHTLHCGGLVNAVSTVLQTDADQLPAIDRHGGLINCLFGDMHVESVSTNTLAAQDGLDRASNSWFRLN